MLADFLYRLHTIDVSFASAEETCLQVFWMARSKSIAIKKKQVPEAFVAKRHNRVFGPVCPLPRAGLGEGN
jgi:hypothetical protein